MLIDTYAATLPAGPIAHIIQALGFNQADAVLLDYGRYGYRQSVKIGHSFLLFDGTPEMGVSLQMQGKAMTEELARRGPAGIIALLHSVRALGGSETRLDVAIDDFTGSIDVQRIREELPNARRPSSKRKYFEEFDDNKGGKRTGATQYIGSMKSHCFIRAYDKAEEQGVDYPWLRWEVQLRDARARQAVDFLLDYEMELGNVAHGLLAGLVTFTEPSATDSNKARWPVAPWWDEFLMGCKKLKLPSLEAVNRTLEQVKQTVERQYGAILATCNIAAESPAAFTAWFQGVVSRGGERLKQRHHDLVDEAKRLRSFVAEQAVDRDALYRAAWGADFGSPGQLPSF